MEGMAFCTLKAGLIDAIRDNEKNGPPRSDNVEIAHATATGASDMEGMASRSDSYIESKTNWCY